MLLLLLLLEIAATALMANWTYKLADRGTWPD